MFGIDLSYCIPMALAAIFAVALILTQRKRDRIIAWLFFPEQGQPWRFQPLQPPTRVDFDLAQQLLPMILSPSGTHRRVEKLTFLGTQRVRRRVSLDVDVPNNRPCVIPLGLIDKRHTRTTQNPLRDVDVTGADGQTLSLVGHRENAEVAWVTTCYAIVRVLRGRDVLRTLVGEIDPAETDVQVWGRLATKVPDLSSIIWQLVSTPADDAAAIRDAIFSADDPLPGVGLAGAAPDAHAVLRTAALGSNLVEALLRRLTTSYLLLAHHPETAAGRVVIKYSLADPIPPAVRRRDRKRTANLSDYESLYLRVWDTLGFWRRMRMRLYLLAAWLGWMGDSVTPRPLTLLPARSVHFEVEAPDGLQFTFARLARRALYPGASDADFVTDEELHRHPTLAHAFLTNLRLDEQLSARLAFSPKSLQLSVAGASTIALATYLWIARPDYGSTSSGYESILLLLPALLGGYLLLAQHDFVRRVTRGVRVMLGLATLSALATAVLMLVSNAEIDGLKPNVLQSHTSRFDLAWSITMWVTTIVGSLLVPASIRAWPGKRLRRPGS